MDGDEYDTNDSFEDGQQKILTMKDQETMMQELKKENFELKLRLYNAQKNGDNAESRASEYEQQLTVLLSSLETQQKLAEDQARELQEVRNREKDLVAKHKRLEKLNQEQDEKIHELSMDLSKAYSSMGNLNETPKHSTPLRNAQSSYINNPADDPSNRKTNVSHVAPMRRDPEFHDESSQRESLIKNDRGVHLSVSEGANYNITNNENNTSYSGVGQRDNVGVVRPNNSRTVVDIEFPDEQPNEPENPKKKKKGVMKLFGLCTGKSGQQPARRDSMYHRKEPAKITVTTHNETSEYL